MDIRLKSIPYSFTAKVVVFICVLISLLILLDFQLLIRADNEAFFSGAFYETEVFQESYVRLSHNAVEKHLDLIDEETIDATRTGLDKSISLNRLGTIDDNLGRAPAFMYLLIDKETGEKITNTDEELLASTEITVEEYIKSFETVVQWDESGLYFPVGSVMKDQPFVYRHYYPSSQFNSTNVTASDVVYRLRSGEWLYYTAVDFNKFGDDILFGSSYYRFMEQKGRMANYIPYVVMGLAIIFLGVIYLAIVTGRRSSDEEPELAIMDHLPLEIQTAIVTVASIPLYVYSDRVNVVAVDYYTRLGHAGRGGFFLGLLMLEVVSVMRLVKTRKIFSNPLVFKLLHWIRRMLALDFNNQLTKVKVIFVIVCYAIFNLFIFIIISLDISGWVFLLALWAFLVVHAAILVYMLTMIGDISSLVRATKRRAEGDIEFPIDENSYKMGLKDFATDLNKLQSGLQVAIEEAVKGEKLKTELITNVSHDLKNPLTSIVTYIDLLDKTFERYNYGELTREEQLELEETLKSYIRVINTKSHRLNTLIEDLVSASKVTSGNVEVHLMHINLMQLILQSYGEKEDRFNEMNLQMVIRPKEKDAFWAHVDPNHMYRIFDNLLSNMIKYSLEGTRVFVTLSEEADEIVVEFKNLSNHPLESEGANLTGRFIRGDAARSGEGSGLGLSIVESLVNIQNGHQELALDGDLFKFTVYVPKGVEPVREPLLKDEDEVVEHDEMDFEGETDIDI